MTPKMEMSWSYCAMEGLLLYDELSNGDVVVVRAMERNSLYPIN